MLLRTLNHQSGVGDVMHCSLRSYKRVYYQRFYNHRSYPFNIFGSLLAKLQINQKCLFYGNIGFFLLLLLFKTLISKLDYSKTDKYKRFPSFS